MSGLQRGPQPRLGRAVQEREARVEVHLVLRARAWRLDRDANAAYIYLTEHALVSGRDTIIAPTPDDANGTTILDWKDGRLVGIEILDADQALHQDLLDQAEDITRG